MSVGRTRLTADRFLRIARDNASIGEIGAVESRPIPTLSRVARTDAGRAVLVTLRTMAQAAAQDENEVRNASRAIRAERAQERADSRETFNALRAIDALRADHGETYAQWAQSVAVALVALVATLRSAKQWTEIDRVLRVAAPDGGSSAPYAHAAPICAAIPVAAHHTIRAMARGIVEARADLARPIAQAGAYSLENAPTVHGAQVGAPLSAIRSERRETPDSGETRKIASVADCADSAREVADTLRRLRAPIAPIEDRQVQIAAQGLANTREAARIATARAKLTESRAAQSAAREVALETANAVSRGLEARVIARAVTLAGGAA